MPPFRVDVLGASAEAAEKVRAWAKAAAELEASALELRQYGVRLGDFGVDTLRRLEHDALEVARKLERARELWDI